MLGEAKHLRVASARFFLALPKMLRYAHDELRNDPTALKPMRVALFVALLLASAIQAAPPTTCGATDDYGKALCAYQQRRFAEAEVSLRAIVERNEAAPQTLHAIYFLARTEMKTGRFDEASALLIRIHDLDPAFYATWNCDYLLGECRKATGKG